MPRVAYVNGRYQAHHQPAIHIEDRGFQFADSVYEVIAVQDGRLADERGHLDRLARSMRELHIPEPVGRKPLQLHCREVIRRNKLRNGYIYIQVSRGASHRDFPFPQDIRPTLVITANPLCMTARGKRRENGVRIITVPDIRWKRRDIKTTGLLAQVLAKQAAINEGAYDAWMVDDTGHVTEGASSNAWIVSKDGRLVTRHATADILKGVTRNALASFCESEGLALEERPFSVDEAEQAREAFMSAAGSGITPVVQINDSVIGNGKPGLLTGRLLELYSRYVSGGAETEIAWTPPENLA